MVNDFSIKRNDTLPNLSLRITSKGKLGEKIPMDLSNFYNNTGNTRCSFSMIDSCGNYKINQNNAEFICVTGGTIQYVFKQEDTDEAGKFKGEFKLQSIDGSIMSVPSIGFINIEIYPDISNK